MDSLADELHSILAERGWLTGEDARPYARDWLDRSGSPPLGVARPASTEEVAAVVRACNRANVPITPQGGNTSLCGGAVCGTPGSVIVSLSRMTQLGAPDLLTGTIEVEAGIVLAKLHEMIQPRGLIFPLHLGAEGSAQIGGLIATNAGGSHVVRYGMMQDLVVGLEVVLPDGTIWNGMRAVAKDNSGYALRRLFCGAEGTLGIVTRAVLKLFPEPVQRVTALLTAAGDAEMLAFAKRLRAIAGEFVSGLEFFSDTGLGLALHHVAGLHYPLETRGAFYLLVELETSSTLVPLEAIAEQVLNESMGSGEVLDGALAMSGAQRAAFWRLREEQPEGQRLEGPQVKNDIAVPAGRLIDFLSRAAERCDEILPGVRINPFGHLGDGNVHYNLSPPAGSMDFSEKASLLSMSIGALAESMQGSFSAEHGLGRTKVALADELRTPIERALMARIKNALDPNGIMNPGVLVGGSLPSTGY